MDAVTRRLGYTTVAIDNFVIVEESEKANGMRKAGVFLKAAALGSLQSEQLSVLSLFLSAASASWQAQAAGM